MSDNNEVVQRILKSSSINGTSLSDCLVSYQGHSLGWGLSLLGKRANQKNVGSKKKKRTYYQPIRFDNKFKAEVKNAKT